MTLPKVTTIIEAAEIAARLDWSRPTFLRRRNRLEAEGFPAMLPGRFGRWDRSRVERWFENHDAIRRLAAENANAPVRIAFDRARLTEIYAGGAA